MADAKLAKSLYSNRIGNSLIWNIIPVVSFYFYVILTFTSVLVTAQDSGNYFQPGL